jgi:subfamily B ATP-binding cassette protein MsbA
MQANDSAGTAPDSTPAPAAASLITRLRRLSVYFGNQRAAWTLAVIATLVGAVTEPLIPALLQPLLDRGFTQGTLQLWIVPLAILGVFFVRGVAQFVGQYALARIANEGMLTLRQSLFDRVLGAEMGLFSRQSASALSNTVVYEVQTGATLLVQALLGISRDGFTLVALLVYLLYLNWQLTLIVAVVVPGVAWIMKTLSRRLYHLTKSSQQATDELAYVVEENVLAHRMVRLHGAQTGQAARFATLSHSLRRLAIKSTIASAAMTPLTQLLAAAALSVVICIALWQSRGTVDAKDVTVGGFVAFITAGHARGGRVGARPGPAGRHRRGDGWPVLQGPRRWGLGTQGGDRVVRRRPRTCTGPGQPSRGAWRNRGPCGPVRRGQDHAGQPAASVCDAGFGRHPA